MALACAKGNERGWWEFDQQHRSYMERVARHLAKTDVDAQEVIDQVYVELYGTKVVDGERQSKFSTYSGRGSLRGWLRTVIWHSIVDLHRAGHDEVSLDEMTETIGEGAAHAGFAERSGWRRRRDDRAAHARPVSKCDGLGDRQGILIARPARKIIASVLSRRRHEAPRDRPACRERRRRRSAAGSSESRQPATRTRRAASMNRRSCVGSKSATPASSRSLRVNWPQNIGLNRKRSPSVWTWRWRTCRARDISKSCRRREMTRIFSAKNGRWPVNDAGDVNSYGKHAAK